MAALFRAAATPLRTEKKEFLTAEYSEYSESCSLRTPTAFRLKAQGWPTERRPTLGSIQIPQNPERVSAPFPNTPLIPRSTSEQLHKTMSNHGTHRTHERPCFNPRSDLSTGASSGLKARNVTARGGAPRAQPQVNCPLKTPQACKAATRFKPWRTTTSRSSDVPSRLQIQCSSFCVRRLLAALFRAAATVLQRKPML